MASINKPVGLKCNPPIGNEKYDVLVIQMLLNKFLMAGCLPPLAPLMLDGQFGNKTCEAIYAFQNGIMGRKKPDMRIDPGGATLARLNGPLKWANKPSGDPAIYLPTPKTPDNDAPNPANVVPDLTGVSRFQFKSSRGFDLSFEKLTAGAGTLYLQDLQENRTRILNYIAAGGCLSAKYSALPGSFDFSTTDMYSDGVVYPNVMRKKELSLSDITGPCMIYQGQVGYGPGGYVTIVFLSVGQGLVAAWFAAMSGVGMPLVPALVLGSCRAVVFFWGVNGSTGSAGVSGALGYVSTGDADVMKKAFENLAVK